jgi:integrase/recombinase XerD
VLLQPDNANSISGLFLGLCYSVCSTDIKRFLVFIGEKTFPQITLMDLQAFSDRLNQEGLENSSIHWILAAVNSLITFAHKIGYLKYDVSQPLRLPKFKDKLAERIFSEAEVQRMIGMESNERNQLLLRMFYTSGVRVSELCNLKFEDLQDRGAEGGQMTIFGKGSKTNTILIPSSLYKDLMEFRKNALGTEPVFKSQKGGRIHPGHVLRIVRHAHASHALDHGCPIHIVQRKHSITAPWPPQVDIATLEYPREKGLEKILINNRCVWSREKTQLSLPNVQLVGQDSRRIILKLKNLRR